MIPRPSDVGVIVGRFQVHRLHDAHLALIKSVYESHSHTVIVLGVAPTRVTHRNPLDFASRQKMIAEAFPTATILYLRDERSDEVWSKELDKLIESVASPAQSVTIYGGRDCFVEHYLGKHKTRVLESEQYVSGSELRKTISKAVKGTEDFRAGVIWASANSYPRVYPTVDVAVWRSTKENEALYFPRDYQFLLARKPNEQGWRFPGGFVQPTDESYAVAAKREVAEELGVEIGNLAVITSMVVDDWRYRAESDKIMTTLFVAQFLFGPVRPADDVSEAKWFPVTEIESGLMVPEHLPLLDSVKMMWGGL